MESELAWFRDYLSNRTQIVSYQNKLSSPRTTGISTGVPQGSILGPLLFVLFINDLTEATAKCSVLLYADDAVLFSSAKDAQTIEQALNYDLSVISDWISQNHLFPEQGENGGCFVWNKPETSYCGGVSNFNWMPSTGTSL